MSDPANSETISRAIDARADAVRRAHALLATDAVIDAAREFELAAQMALSDYDTADAIDHLTTAISSLLKKCTHERAHRAIDLAARIAALTSAHDTVTPSSVWEPILEACVREKATDARARALYEASSFANSDAAVALMSEAATVSVDSGWSRRAAAFVARTAGREQEALALDIAAHDFAVDTGDHLLEALCLDSIANIRVALGYPEDLIRLRRQALALALQSRHANTWVRTGVNLSAALLDHLQAEQGRNVLASVRGRLSHDAPSLSAAASLSIYEVMTQVAFGNLTAAWSRSSENLQSLDDLHPQRLDTLACAIHAELMVERGFDRDRARDVVARGRAIDVLMNFAPFRWELDAIDARLTLVDGAIDAAHDLYARLDRDDINSCARHARHLARNGVLHDQRASIELARAMIRDDAQFAPLDRLIGDEIDLYLDQSATRDELLDIARRWLTGGYHLDALIVRLSAAALDARAGNALRSRRDLIEILPQLTERGAIALANVVRDLLAGRIARVADRALIRSNASDHDDTIWRGLTPADIERVSSCSAALSLRTGAIVFTADHPPTSMYVVRQGRVRLARASARGKHLTVALLDAGKAFGALPGHRSDHVASYAAHAIEDLEVDVIGRSDAESLLRSIPQLAVNLFEQAIQRWERAEALAEQIAFRSVRHRLAHTLLALDERFGHPTIDGHRVIAQRLTQSELADMVGATRKAVTLIINEWKRDGLIELRRGRIAIVAPSALADLIEAA